MPRSDTEDKGAESEKARKKRSDMTLEDQRNEKEMKQQERKGKKRIESTENRRLYECRK